MWRVPFKHSDIDIHKKMLVVTIAKTDEHKATTYQTKYFSTTTQIILSLILFVFNSYITFMCVCYNNACCINTYPHFRILCFHLSSNYMRSSIQLFYYFINIFSCITIILNIFFRKHFCLYDLLFKITIYNVV